MSQCPAPTQRPEHGRCTTNGPVVPVRRAIPRPAPQWSERSDRLGTSSGLTGSACCALEGFPFQARWRHEICSRVHHMGVLNDDRAKRALGAGIAMHPIERLPILLVRQCENIGRASAVNVGNSRGQFVSNRRKCSFEVAVSNLEFINPLCGEDVNVTDHPVSNSNPRRGHQSRVMRVPAVDPTGHRTTPFACSRIRRLEKPRSCSAASELFLTSVYSCRIPGRTALSRNAIFHVPAILPDFSLTILLKRHEVMTWLPYVMIGESVHPQP